MSFDEFMAWLERIVKHAGEIMNKLRK